MENTLKEVRFDIWCQKCKNYKTPETDDPCNECLDYPANENSHRPLLFEEVGK